MFGWAFGVNFFGGEFGCHCRAVLVSIGISISALYFFIHNMPHMHIPATTTTTVHPRAMRKRKRAREKVNFAFMVEARVEFCAVTEVATVAVLIADMFLIRVLAAATTVVRCNNFEFLVAAGPWAGLGRDTTQGHIGSPTPFNFIAHLEDDEDFDKEEKSFS